MLENGRRTALDEILFSAVLYKQACRICGETCGREKSFTEQLADKAILQGTIYGDMAGMVLVSHAFLAIGGCCGLVVPVKRRKQQDRQNDR